MYNTRLSFIKLLMIMVLGSFSMLSKGQEKGRLISGNVRSSQDLSPLAGVSVEASKSGLQSGSQEDGNFFIEVKSQDSVLVFKMPGFKVKEVRLGKPYEYQVFLEPEKDVSQAKLGLLTLKTPYTKQ